jgi:hypothetical protein
MGPYLLEGFGLLEAVEWDNLTRELYGVHLLTSEDRVSWLLDPSVHYEFDVWSVVAGIGGHPL